MCWIWMCLTLPQPRVKQSGAPVFKQPIVPPGLLIHFYHCLSSFQNKCSKPGLSHHNSDIYNLWSLTVLHICLHYDSMDWNLWSGKRRRPISDRVGQYSLLWGLYGGLCVTVWINFSLYILRFVFKSSLFWLCQCAMNGKVKAIWHFFYFVCLIILSFCAAFNCEINYI